MKYLLLNVIWFLIMKETFRYNPYNVWNNDFEKAFDLVDRRTARTRVALYCCHAFKSCYIPAGLYFYSRHLFQHLSCKIALLFPSLFNKNQKLTFVYQQNMVTIFCVIIWKQKMEKNTKVSHKSSFINLWRVRDMVNLNSGSTWLVTDNIKGKNRFVIHVANSKIIHTKYQTEKKAL